MIIPRLASAADFQKQLQDRARAVKTDITQLPFRIQMEVKGPADSLARTLAPLKWTTASAAGD